MIAEMNFEKVFEIEENLTIHVKRKIRDESFIEKFKFIPIQNDAFYHLPMGKTPFFLPKLYAALVHLTGSSDSMYDDYKGSYSFTFTLKVTKNGLISYYLYHLFHYRSYIEFSIYQIDNGGDTRDPSILHQPNEELFSNKDICHFSNYFCGYCIGYLKGSKHTPLPFVKNSDSNLLLFGYFEDKYFFKSFDDSPKYHEEKSILCERIFLAGPEEIPF